ncbi:MAG: hypothetical protein QXR40_00375 [Candidatus Bathyarchaeia archaeon]
MILITTSHRPTRRVRSLCNDLARSIPGLVRVNRGKMSLLEVAEKTIQLGAGNFIVIDRWKGGPGRIRLFKISESGFDESPPRLYISGVKLRREFRIPREILDKKIDSVFLDASNPLSPETDKFRLSIAEFLGLPVIYSVSEALNYEACMRISADEDCWAYISFYFLSGNVEFGPRIKISHVVWDV